MSKKASDNLARTLMGRRQETVAAIVDPRETIRLVLAPKYEDNHEFIVCEIKLISVQKFFKDITIRARLRMVRRAHGYHRAIVHEQLAYR